MLRFYFLRIYSRYHNLFRIKILQHLHILRKKKNRILSLSIIFLYFLTPFVKIVSISYIALVFFFSLLVFYFFFFSFVATLCSLNLLYLLDASLDILNLFFSFLIHSNLVDLFLSLLLEILIRFLT